jgi:protein-S-isoprenylcysteine O-methyltransferase Ste14
VTEDPAAAAPVLPRWTRVPPPLLFAAVFLAGLGLQRLLGLAGPPQPLLRVGQVAGSALLGAGMLLALSCLSLFLRAGTTLVPHRRSAALVERGPYRISRNPMYVSLVLAYLGVALLLGAPGPLLLLPVPVWILQHWVIPNEERLLRAEFGESYADYGRRVRRWL